VPHAQEREIIEKLEIAKIWRPIPFPREPGGGASKVFDQEVFVDTFRNATKRATAVIRYRVDPLLLTDEKPEPKTKKPKRKKPAKG
jgi:hypothetical protein